MQKVIKILKKLLNIWCRTSLILVYVFSIPVVLFVIFAFVQMHLDALTENEQTKCEHGCSNDSKTMEAECNIKCYDKK
jgi:hypothetical protein